ncbi:hypothetical protein JTB14_009220 [Gonioctena quinquepunctata]|nr:hypothetical protein JTB14_009220 [Gonioctena quinquepunctata]
MFSENDCGFEEKSTFSISINDEIDIEIPMQERPAINADQEEVTDDEEEDQRELEDNLRPQRNIRLPTKFQDYDLNFVEIDVPKTYQEALNTYREIYDTLLQEDVSEEELMLEIDCCEGYEKKFIVLRITYGNRQKHIDIGLDEDDRRSRANLAMSKSTLGPADPHTILIKVENISEKLTNIPYREAVGSLMFAAVVSCPDIAYSVGVASRFLNDPSKTHWNAVERIIRYLNATSELGIHYSKEEQLQLSGFSDSDYASDKDTRKSTTGYIFKLCNAAVTWSSKRQHAVTLSTTEAEYVAACQATKEAIRIRRLMNDIGESVSMATPLNIDNQSAIKLIHNPEFHKRTKHVDIQFHFVREKFQDGEIEPVYVSTKLQEADLLTKALPRTSFLNLRNLIGMKKKNEINVK